MAMDGEHTITAGGVDHWVRVVGAEQPGVPVMLIHGGPGSNAYQYEKLGGRLGRGVPVVLYDQRGCGRSASPPEEVAYTMAQLLHDVDDIRVALGFDAVVPWGVSFGCIIAAEYAVAYPNHVARLILHAPPIVGPLHPDALTLQLAAIDSLATPATRDVLRGRLSDVDDPMERVLLAHKVIADDAVTRQRFAFHSAQIAAEYAAAKKPDFKLNRRMSDDLLPASRRTDLVDDLASLDIETLLLVGLWDGHVGVDTVRNLTLRLRRASLRLFEHSAHSPHIEEPDEYLAAMQRFLNTA